MKTGIALIAFSLAIAFVFPACVPGAPDAALAGLRLGQPVRSGNLTVIPVYSDKPESREELVPLKEALQKKWLEIKETGDGEVSRVVLNNLSDKKIFILSGEVISGAKQDRIISGDRIIDARQRDIDLDVFCVEAGRWTYESDGFYTKENMGTATLREKAQRQAPESQSEIWGEISRVNAENQVASESDAYQDIYDQKEIKDKLERVEKSLLASLDPKAVGVVVGIGGKVKSIDIFQNTTLFAHYWPVILKSSALAAVTSKEQGDLDLAEAEKMLAAARNKSARDGVQPGKNRAKISVDEEINASTLDSEKGEVHFSAFPVEKEKNDAIRDVDLDQVNDNVLNNNLNLRQE